MKSGRPGEIFKSRAKSLNDPGPVRRRSNVLIIRCNPLPKIWVRPLLSLTDFSRATVGRVAQTRLNDPESNGENMRGIERRVKLLGLDRLLGFVDGGANGTSGLWVRRLRAGRSPLFRVVLVDELGVRLGVLQVRWMSASHAAAPHWVVAHLDVALQVREVEGELAVLRLVN